MKYFALEVKLIAINTYFSCYQVSLLPVKGVVQKRIFKVTLRSRFIFER